MLLSALILTKNEEKNIEKCIKSLREFEITDIHVLDSFSTDRTQEISALLGAKLYQRKFDNHLKQTRYALETFSFENNYVLRIDADEELQCLNKDSARSLAEICASRKLSSTIAGAGIRSYAFLGRAMNYMPVSNVLTLRIVHHGNYSMNDRNIDESFTADVVVPNTFTLIDNCKKGFWHFFFKHIRYGIQHGQELSSNRKTLLKNKNYRRYLRYPTIIRPFILFFYYLIFRKGYKDGLRGVLYLLVQTLVMRLVADVIYVYLQVRR